MKHALLSASASHRWLNCTPSARLEETFPETTSEYAEEGRLAHEIAELKLRKFVEPMSQKIFNSSLKQLTKHELFQDEMLRHTDTYFDYIAQLAHGQNSPPYIAIEKKIDYSNYAPQGFGTGDCIIIAGQTLYVIDFKYGKGVSVSATDNPQMQLYALGAYTEYSFLYDIQYIKLVIIQPRMDNISEYLMAIEELTAWGETIKPIAQKAYDGEGEFKPGDYCRFCRAKSLCRARADFNMALEQHNFSLPPLLSNYEVGQILKRACDLVSWINSLEDYALNECLSGNEVDGFKAVEGISRRKFKDVDAAFETLIANGYDEAILYERNPITLASVEKLLGKAKFTEILKDYVDKGEGKPTLVPLSDKREAIRRISAKDEF